MFRVNIYSKTPNQIRTWVPNPLFGVRSIHNLAQKPQIKMAQTFLKHNITLMTKQNETISTNLVLARFLAQSSRRPPISTNQEMPEWMKEELERAKKRERKDAARFNPELQEELARLPDDVNIFDNLILTFFFLMLLYLWGPDAVHKFTWSENQAFMCFDYPHLKSPKYGVNDPYVCFKHYAMDQRTEEILSFHAVKFYPHFNISSPKDKFRIAFNPTNPAEFTWKFENDMKLYATLALKAGILILMGKKLVKQYRIIVKEYDTRRYFRKLFNFGD